MTEAEFQRLVNQRIREFVADMTTLARRHAAESVSKALLRDALSPDLRSRGKRTAAEIERTAEALLAHIVSHPGQRMEEIADHVGVPSRELSLPLRRLVDAERVVTEGQKRATRYFPTGGSRRRSRRSRQK